MQIEVRTGKLEEVLDLQNEIPELENPYSRTAYEHRLSGVHSIILIAEIARIPIGFKVGYDRFKDHKTFYSWMGGVHPSYRKMGVAKLLLEKMEVWCRIKGYEKLQFKTMNKHRPCGDLPSITDLMSSTFSETM